MPLGEISHIFLFWDQLVMRRLIWARAVLTGHIWWLNFNERLSLVMLYVKNAPSQSVKPVKPISKHNN